MKQQNYQMIRNYFNTETPPPPLHLIKTRNYPPRSISHFLLIVVKENKCACVNQTLEDFGEKIVREIPRSQVGAGRVGGVLRWRMLWRFFKSVFSCTYDRFFAYFFFTLLLLIFYVYIYISVTENPSH